MGIEQGSSRTNFSSLDLNLLVSLHALIEEESVTNAANRVGVSQPAMSHSLRRIRRLLGDEVLVRRRGFSELTPRAQSMREPLREILLRTDALISGAEFDPATDDRTVTVALTSSSITVMGARLLRAVYEQAPNMRVRLRVSWTSTEEMYAAEKVDVALLPRATSAQYPRERLYDDGWVVVAGQGELTDENVVEAIRTRPHIVFDTGRVSFAYDVLRAHGIHVDVRATVSDSLVLANLVAGGPFVAIHREQVVRTLAEQLGLAWVPLPFDTGTPGVDMVWSPWLADDGFKEWFREILLSCAP